MTIDEKIDFPEREQVTTSSSSRGAALWKWRAAFIGTGVAFAIAMFLVDDSIAVGLMGIMLMLVLLLAKLPVAIAMAVPSLIGLYALLGTRAVEGALSSVPFDATAEWSLSVLPMFIMMGYVLQRSGITSEIYRAASAWIGWMPGGLGIATNVAGAGMATVSGSSMATTFTLARVGLPEMLSRGYDRRVALGSVAFASLAGNLIPPSLLLVLYAGAAGVPVGPQLMAGLVPGFIIVAATCLLILVVGRMWPRLVGRESGSPGGETQVDWRDRWQSLRAVWPLPVLIVLVLGSMYTGIFTATEAAAAGALASVVLTMILRRNQSVGIVATAATESVRTLGSIFFLLAGAALLNRLLTTSGLASAFSEWVAGAGISRVQFILLLLVAYLIMGMFLESVTMMLVTVPVLLPILTEMGIDPIWFGVFVVLVAEIGMLSPPVGILSFIIYGITREPEINRGRRITLTDVFVSVLWFMPAVVVLLALLIAFPGLATWLPNGM